MSAGAIPFHPLADLFPLIEGPDFEALCADIAKNGLRQKIQLWRGTILDGRNRYRAIATLGDGPLDPAKAPDWFEDVSHIHERLLASHVVSLNLRRRHLDESQRALIAARLASLGHGGARVGQDANLRLELEAEPVAVPGVAIDDAAAMLNVSPRQVDEAKALVREAPQAVLDRVQRGEASVHGARRGVQAAKELLATRGEEISPDAVQRAYDLLREEQERKRAEAKARKQQERAARETRLAGRIAEANAALESPQKRYGVILADPEWKFETWGQGGMDRSPENHYPTSATDAIAARPVANLAAPDCVLFLWATAPMLPDALHVMEAWGFQYKSHAIWDKEEIVLGYWFRFRHELLLIGTRGRVPAPAPGTQFPSIIAAPLAAHSAKPERFHALIEAYFPNVPKIELNARAARPGWDVWGAEAPEEE